MAHFKWYNRYSVENNELDKHHKTLFDIINRLNTICLVNDKADCFDSLIEELVSYSNYHFIAEEQHMRDIGYKEIDKHTIEHRLFKLKLQQEVGENKYENTKKLIAFLVDWLVYHVIVEDKKYAVQSTRRF